MAPTRYSPLEMEKEDVRAPRISRRRHPSKLTFTAVILAGICLLGWYWNSDGFHFGRSQKHGAMKKPCREAYQAPRKNIWADLDDEEVDDVLKYLYTVPNDLNLTKVGKAGPWDNHVAIIEVLVPNKTDALPYLNEDTATPPPRYARVIINRGAAETAGIDNYMVGPLPTSPNTTISPLTWAYNSGRYSVDNPLPNYEDILAWFSDIGDQISDIVDDLLGDKIVNPGHYDNAPPLIAVSRPAAFENGTVSSWARIHSPGLRLDAWSLLAQAMFARFEITGRDSSKWAIREWYYGGVLYNSTEAFRDAWKAGEVQKVPANVDGKWSDSAPDEEGMEGREQVAPVMIQPGGPRYKLDENERHVSWLGWSFYINSLQAIGLGLWDVKFDGERVLYELGLQEAMAHYAGDDPLSVGMNWLDTLFGMGFNSYELVPGYDCPAYATFLPMSFHQGEKTITRKNSLCIFEWTASETLQRHTSPAYVTVSRNNYLVVRQVATVGNYDYTISYMFYLDGSVEVKVQASGYIFAAYHGLETMRKDMKTKRSEHAQYNYGYQIQNLIASSMHDHEINFKADFDIAGTANTMERVGVVPYHKTYDWENVHRSTMRLEHEIIDTERGLNWPANAGAMYVIMNNETTNKWGEKRGYRITPGTGMGTPPHLTIHNSPSMAKSASWAYKDLWLLRHHDTERRSASEYNALAPQDPLVDFEKMVDGEEAVQQDLVVYFNLGSHHVPHSGDVPNTLMHTSASSVMFVPVNFHDRDPSRVRAQGVKVMMREEGRPNVAYFGGRFEQDVLTPVDQLEPDLSSYSVPEDALRDLSWNATLAAL